MAYDLSSLGWGADLAAAYGPLDRSDAVPARVLRVELGVCTVIGVTGVSRASLAGTMLLGAAADLTRLPCVGDWVAVRRWADRRMTVEAVLPRRTVLSGGPADRMLAANVDTVAVIEPARRLPGVGRVAELLAVAQASGASPMIVVPDRAGLPEQARVAAHRRLAAAFPGVPVLPIGSAGLRELRGLVAPGRTLALLGADDAGLVEALAGVAVLPVRAQPRRAAGHPWGGALVPVPEGGAVLDLTGVGETRRSFRPPAQTHAEARPDGPAVVTGLHARAGRALSGL